MANSLNKLSIAGDLEEEFNGIVVEKGIIIAQIWYLEQILILIPTFILSSFYWSIQMFKNYLKTALRYIRRRKLYSIINIFGLAVAMACCILLFSFIRSEINYDRFHKNIKDIYRVLFALKDGIHTVQMAPLAPAIAAEFPEIIMSVRFWQGSSVVKSGDNLFTEQILYADPNFLSMFTFPLLTGSSEKALVDPYSVILSEKTAVKYFGSNNPLGTQLSIKLGERFHNFIVTGIAQEIPLNSSLRFDFLLPFSNIIHTLGTEYLSNWTSLATNTFIMLRPGGNPTGIEAQSHEIAKKYFSGFLEAFHRSPEELRFILQPFSEYHLGPFGGGNGLAPHSNKANIYILSGIAFIILLIACFNFMNLTVGLASTRFREVGMRKVLGAGKRQLVRQFLLEAIVLSFISLLAGMVLAVLLLPVFNSFIGMQLVLNHLGDWRSISLLASLSILIGITAGLYPALIQSRFNIVEIFKGSQKIGGKNLLTRLLVIIQFASSIFFIVSAIFMFLQLRFIKSKDIGFNKEQVVIVSFGGGWYSTSDKEQDYYRYKNAITGHARIINVAGSSKQLTRGLSSAPIQYEDRKINIYYFKVDEDFLNTLGLELLAGRNFRSSSPSDKNKAIIVNEMFVKKLELKDAVGKQLTGIRLGLIDDPVIIGVVKDYNFRPLKHKIEPAVLIMHYRRPILYAYIKIDPHDVQKTIAFLGNSWSQMFPEQPFNYYFLDDIVEGNYRNEERWNRIIGYASALAIMVACMGLFGLVSLVVAYRRKEMGIRKVLGATAARISLLICRDFLVLVGISNILAWPAAYFFITKWLADFPYRIDIGVDTFFFGGIITLCVAGLSISYLVIKSARANPVESIRYE